MFIQLCKVNFEHIIKGNSFPKLLGIDYLYSFAVVRLSCGTYGHGLANGGYAVDKIYREGTSLPCLPNEAKYPPYFKNPDQIRLVIPIVPFMFLRVSLLVDFDAVVGDVSFGNFTITYLVQIIADCSSWNSRCFAGLVLGTSRSWLNGDTPDCSVCLRGSC